MKILPLVNNIRNDISASGIRIRQASKDGYSIAGRAAKIYKQPNYVRYINVTRSVSNKIIKGTTGEEIPYIAGAIGMFVPLPLTSPIFLGLGFIFRALLYSTKKQK